MFRRSSFCACKVKAFIRIGQKSSPENRRAVTGWLSGRSARPCKRPPFSLQKVASCTLKGRLLQRHGRHPRFWLEEDVFLNIEFTLIFITLQTEAEDAEAYFASCALDGKRAAVPAAGACLRLRQRLIRPISPIRPVKLINK